MMPSAKFIIATEVNLTPDQTQSLSLLYQPIMGVDAFSLYFLFLSLSKNMTYTHHLLLQITGGDMKKFILNRHQLEGVGLVDVYESEELMTYVVKKPLNIEQFFNDAIMRAFLSVKIGVADFNFLKQSLTTTITLDIDQKKTKRFDEVYDVRVLNNNVQPFEKSNEATTVGIEIAEIFNAEYLLSVFTKKAIPITNITPRNVEIINELAFLYKFDIHELAYFVFDAMTPAGIIDEVKLKHLARRQFQIMNKGDQVKIVVKDETFIDGLEVSKDESSDGIMSFLEQSPIEFLRFKSGGLPPVPADVRLVEWLFVDQSMPAGVVNVLVDYVLNYTDGQLPKQLVEKIAGQWQRQGIKTTEAAMKKVETTITKGIDYKKNQENPKAITKAQQMKKATRIEPIPDWLEKSQSVEMTDEEKNASLKRIEEMKKMMTGGVGDAEIK